MFFYNLNDFRYFCSENDEYKLKKYENFNIMSKPLSILFVSSEVFPFSKETGIADISYSLPLAIKELGHDVRVMMPKYGNISERKSKIHDINRLKNIPIQIGDTTYRATIKSSSVQNPKGKVQAYIATNNEFFNSRKGIYHDPCTWEFYKDNAERFIFFNKAVIETCIILGWFPDIIHVNDWQTAILPALVREFYPEEFKNTKFVFTIHNFYRQGMFAKNTFKLTGFDKSIQEKFTHKNKFNFMKAGIIYSDYVTTVSETYAKEIMDDDRYSHGLNEVLKEKKDVFKGILNGLDPYVWNPAKDMTIDFQLESSIELFKEKNKEALQTEFSFEPNDEIPIISLIPRIGYQKGVTLLIDAADELFKRNVRVILLGQGDEELKQKLQAKADKYPDKFKLRFEFDEELSHRIEAGSDMFLMPSQYEPCGLNCMFSMAYGTVPIVRATGGLKDITNNYDPETRKGDAFVFEKYSAKDMLKAIDAAIEAYSDKSEWNSIIDQCMSRDFAWQPFAKQYEKIYSGLVK